MSEVSEPHEPGRQKPRPGLPDGPYLVVGLARSGVAGALALAAHGQRVIGVDAGQGAQTQRLTDAGIEVHLGEDGLELLQGIATVIKSPGVSSHVPILRAAAARGLTVMGELELAWRMLPNQFIAITGTNGKTTTVELVGHIHRQAGLPVALAGNVGAALSGLVGNIDHRVTVVCEASSFQLQDTLAFAPEAALLLNITPDHLDRHASLEDYRAAKLQIFARQEEPDLAVLACDAPISPGGRARRVRFGSCEDALVRERGTRLWWRGEALLELSELSLRGAHNVQNAMAAAAVCLERGVPIDAVRAGLKSFPGVAHRLQEITRRNGVIFINDSKATNVASTRVALAAFADTQVHLILGGQGKGQDFTALAQSVRGTCRAVYLIGQDAPLIASALANSGVALHHSGDLAHAVAQASQAALEGEVVLLSPGCASFDQFEDFEARGERFIELVGG